MLDARSLLSMVKRMIRIIECAAGGVLLVIPDDSHLWRRAAESREKNSKLRRDRDAKPKAETAAPTARARTAASS
jgi:hypothetical protein